MNSEQVSEFEQLQAQLHSLYLELGVLSKRKPDDAVNTFKLKLINKVLDHVNEILDEKYRPFDDFTRFNEDEMPTNSDVVLVLSQYMNCLEKLRADNVSNVAGNWYWVINEERSNIKTGPPKKLKY